MVFLVDYPTRKEFVGEEIFGLTAYDSEMTGLFTDKALETCDSITHRTTHQYLETSRDKYQWFY